MKEYKKNRCPSKVGRLRQRLKGSDTGLPYPTPYKHFTFACCELSILAAWYCDRLTLGLLANWISTRTNQCLMYGGVATAKAQYGTVTVGRDPLGGTRQAQRFSNDSVYRRTYSGFAILSELLKATFHPIGTSQYLLPIRYLLRRRFKLSKVLDGQPRDLRRVLSLSNDSVYRRTYSGFAILSELLRPFYGVFLVCFSEFSRGRRDPSGFIFSHSHTLLLEV